MWGPLLFDNRRAIVKKIVLQKKNFNSKKKLPKKPFSQKKLFTEHEFEKFQQEKIKIKGMAFISKKFLKSHFRDPKKAFFSISYFEKCFCMQSLPTANC